MWTPRPDFFRSSFVRPRNPGVPFDPGYGSIATSLPMPTDINEAEIGWATEPGAFRMGMPFSGSRVDPGIYIFPCFGFLGLPLQPDRTTLRAFLPRRLVLLTNFLFFMPPRHVIQSLSSVRHPPHCAFTLGWKDSH